MLDLFDPGSVEGGGGGWEGVEETFSLSFLRSPNVSEEEKRESSKGLCEGAKRRREEKSRQQSPTFEFRPFLDPYTKH